VALYHNKEEYDDIETMGLPLSNDGKPVPSQSGTTCGRIPKGAKKIAVAKEFLKYLIEPKVNNEYLKVGLGRDIPCMPSIVKDDPGGSPTRIGRPTPGRACSARTIPTFWSFNPAYAQVQNEHVSGTAWADIMQGGMTRQAAAEKAFKRIEDIFAKYPVGQA
jgi:multiple sugar transport system substrate-binding protein